MCRYPYLSSTVSYTLLYITATFIVLSFSSIYYRKRHPRISEIRLNMTRPYGCNRCITAYDNQNSNYMFLPYEKITGRMGYISSVLGKGEKDIVKANCDIERNNIGTCLNNI